MAVTQQTPLNTYTANGATTAFAFEFLLGEAGDLVVQVTDTAGATTTKALGVDYTISGLGVASGGTVTFTGAPANGYTVTIYRDTDLARSTDYPTNGDLPSATLDADFDRLWLALQEVFSGGKGVPNSLRAPTGETLPALGNATARASRVLAFDTNGDPVLIAGVDASSAAALALDLAASNNAAKGAGQVGFAQSLAYGASTIGAHAKRFPTAKDAPWLATGDGTTTDTTALQAFLTANAGGSCTIPPGTYKTGALTVPANTTVWGFGATLDFSAAGNITGLDLSAGGVTLIGLDILGPGNASYDDNSRGIACFGTNNSPSAPTFVNGPRVLMCKVRSWKGYGVFLGYTNGGDVRGCTITSCGYAGVGGVSCNDLFVVGNYIRTVTPGSGGGDAYGVFVDRFNGTSETAWPRSYRCHIDGNTIRDVATTTGNNGQAINTHAGVDFSISHNVIDNCEVGIFVTSSVISSVQQLAPKRVAVIGNTINDTQRLGYGIQVAGAMDGATVNEYAEGIVVSGNSITGHGIAADGSSGAIRIQAVRDLVLTSNVITRPACNGIVFNTECLNFQASGNIVRDPFDSSYTTPAGVFFDSINNTGQISGGGFYYQNSGLGTYVAVNSIRFDGSLTGINVDLGRHSFINIDATHLTFVDGSNSGIYADDLMKQCGSTSLSGGTVTVVFGKRFPSTPKVFVQGKSDTNAMRVSAVSTTQMTVTGTGTTSIDWQAHT